MPFPAATMELLSKGFFAMPLPIIAALTLPQLPDTGDLPTGLIYLVVAFAIVGWSVNSWIIPLIKMARGNGDVPKGEMAAELSLHDYLVGGCTKLLHQVDLERAVVVPWAHAQDEMPVEVEKALESLHYIIHSLHVKIDELSKLKG